jgi:hypothetical protein
MKNFIFGLIAGIAGAGAGVQSQQDDIKKLKAEITTATAGLKTTSDNLGECYDKLAVVEHKPHEYEVISGVEGAWRFDKTDGTMCRLTGVVGRKSNDWCR